MSLYITGVTPDGMPLAGGLFALKDTHGLPLDLAYELCKERKLAPDWLEYLLDAGRQAQWKWDAAFAEMQLLVGPTIAVEIGDRYKNYLTLRWKEQSGGEDFAALNERVYLEKRQRALAAKEAA